MPLVSEFQKAAPALIQLTLAICVLSCAHLYALTDERQRPKEPEEPAPEQPVIPTQQLPGEQDKTILIEALDGIRFVSELDQIVPKDIKLLGLDLVQVPILDTDEFRARLKPFLGKPVSMARIRDLQQLTHQFYQEKGTPFVKVNLPEQDITSGVIHLLVKESRLGKVSVEGAHYVAEERYRKAIPTKEGDRIFEKDVVDGLNYFNKSAFRRIKPLFTPGEAPDTTDLVLKAEERFPVRFYAGYEDTGSQSTGLDRIVKGFNWGDGFLQDHQIGYQFATDIEYSRLQSHSGYWRIPLPHRHKLSLSGGYSTSRSESSPQFDDQGVNWQAALRYEIPLINLLDLDHSLDLGFDFKQAESNLEFGGQEIFASSVDTTQFVANYSGRQGDRWGRSMFSVSGYFSPGHLTTRQRSEDYVRARVGTDPQYLYGDVEFEREWKCPKDISLVHRIRGQFSTNRLQSTEQLLLGGFDSVRGYDDRLIAADEGVQVNVELRSPDWKLGRLGGSERFESRLQVLVFYDYGWGYVKDRFLGETKNSYLSSVGGGIRYRLGTHVDVRADYGRQLQSLKGGLAGGDHGRLHLGVVVSF